MNVFCSACGEGLAEGDKFCKKCGASTIRSDIQVQPPTPEYEQGLRCKTCDSGLLRPTKRYRMSSPVVAIGYIILVPSLLGILFSVLLLVSVGHTGSTLNADMRERSATEMRNVGVAEPIVQKVISSEELTTAERATLTTAQTEEIGSAKSIMQGSQLGTGAGTVIGGGISIFFGIVSFVGGLLGWLLVMKKKVLQCTKCGVTVAAG